MNVVVVEDHPGFAAALELWLASLGHSVVTYSNSQSAIEHLSGEGAVDVALVDLGLLDGDSGLRVTTWISAHRPELVRVLMTGRRCPTEFQSDRRTQFFLQKPFEVSALWRLLTHVANTPSHPESTLS